MSECRECEKLRQEHDAALAQVEAMRGALEAALRQWRGYAEERAYEHLATAEHEEGRLFQRCTGALSAIPDTARVRRLVEAVEHVARFLGTPSMPLWINGARALKAALRDYQGATGTAGTGETDAT
jgi:hypothetical protein